MKAVAYVRGSTEKQKNTLETQTRTAEDYCRYQQLDLVHVFVDSDEKGADSFYIRPEAQALLRYCEENDINQIVMAKLDRSFRNAKDCLTVIDELRSKRGIEFHILDCQVDTRAATGRLFMTILAAIAEWENGRRRERQLENFETMRINRQRSGGGIPYGWYTVPSSRMSKTGRQADDLLPDPSQQLTLAAMLEMRGRGIGFSAIAKWLNGEAIPSATGGRWHPSTVQSVLAHARLQSPESGDGKPESIPPATGGDLSLSGLRIPLSGLLKNSTENN